ncbi:MAG: oligosaccharide flippase family protein [Candidatus Cloacimonetes bacterium]|nr:oligosaccharide flippase family protein [Candidatus Cloacimonadota bacterium]
MGYKSNILSNLFNQGIKLILGAFISIVVARTLGPANQGYIAYLILIFTLIGSYGHLGITNATIYFQKRSQHRESHLLNVNASALLFMFILITVAVGVLRITGIAFKQYGLYLMIAGLVLAFSHLWAALFISFYTGNERIIESNRIDRHIFIAKAILITVLWQAGYLDRNSLFALTVLGMLILTLLLYRRLGLRWSPAWDGGLLKQELAYGSVVYLSGILLFLHYRIDQFVIKMMLGNSELGIYSIAVTLAEWMFLVPTSIITALTGKLYNTYDDRQNQTVTAQTVKYTLYLCSALCLIGVLASRLIPLVYGPEFAGAAVPTMILLAGVVFASVAKVSFMYYLVKGNPYYHLIIAFITFALNLLLNLLLIPRFGITGAALASSISYFIYGCYYLILFVCREKFGWRSVLIFGRADIRFLKTALKPENL